MVALAEIQAYADEIARRFRPERIILFGSHARDAATADSDVDLLVVIPDEGDQIKKAVDIRCAIPRRFPLDLLVRDPRSFATRLSQGDMFLREIAETGRVLYEARDQ